MIGVDCEGLLTVVAEAARARQPLPPALRASGVAGAPELAKRLEAGMDLPGACAGLLPPSLALLLAGERPRLEHAALFAAGQLRAAQQRRHHLLLVVVPALLSLAAAIAVLAVVAGPLGLAADWRWLLAAAAGAGLVVLPLAGLAEAGWSAALGPFTAWARHGRWAWRWERAALVARWRPDEATLALIGSDLLALGEVLARADAEDHCRRLAAWHRARAEAGVRRLGLVLALGLALMTGSVLLAAVVGPVRGFYDAAAWVEPAGAVP